jgi:type II secretory pathway component PulJ
MRLTPIPVRRSTPPGGFSLLELMIGITVGLFILLGASSLMVSQIGDHRRLALETRTEQDVRAVAELVARDLKNAGGWADAMKGVWTESNAAPLANPNGTIQILDGGSTVLYRTRLGNAGFKRDGQQMRRLDLGNWQPMTDPETVKITVFNVTANTHTQLLDSTCALPCDGLADCPPEASIRELRVQLEAEATHDARVQRKLDFTVRLQGDVLKGVCRGA